MRDQTSQRHPYLESPGALAIAHRGGAAEGLENTMTAFTRSFDVGFRYFETDVRVTSDGVVVAYHDDDLRRACGRPGRISQLPWREVSAARVAGVEPIPRLIDLLEAFPSVRLNIDCKSDRVVGPLGDELERSGALDRVCVGSFSDRRLWQMRRRFGSSLCSSVGPGELAMLRIAGWAGGRVNAVQAPVNWHGVTVIDAGLVQRYHRRGLDVHVWTIDDKAEMEQLLDLGVDGIMTDRPKVLKDLLVERGEWY